MAVKEFLTDEEQDKVIEAIKKAELRTSGEIRVHLEPKCKKDALDRAKEVFAELGMQKTELRNGVIVYLATDSKKVAVYGDEGIHDQVGQAFWDDVLKLMVNHFKQDQFGEGLEKAVLRIGTKLQEMFPHQRDDENELSDDISYDDPGSKE